MIVGEWVRESPLYERVRGGKVRCGVCERRCLLEENERGFCKTRINIGGKLYTIVYGNLSALESRPIEIKPFYHFWPGSTALTFSTWSCNFTCPWCQNWHLSRTQPSLATANYVPPERVVKMASGRDEGVCVSFNEPLMLFEYSLEVFRLARARNLYCTYVSNGYMTLDALKMLRDSGLDGLKIDVKGGEEEYRRFNKASVDVVWRNAREAVRMGIHVEIVYLVVTDATDSESLILETIERHLNELGENVPLHFTRYFPAYRYHAPPTPVEKLEWAYEQARRMGVRFPYIGNVIGHRYENTYCPECGELLIRRYGPRVIRYRITDDARCPKCGSRVPITGRYIRKSFLRLLW